MFDPQTATYIQDAGDRLGLSVPHVKCRTCHRLYPCRTDIEIALCECGDCEDVRTNNTRKGDHARVAQSVVAPKDVVPHRKEG